MLHTWLGSCNGSSSPTLRMKAASIFNSPAKLGTAKLKKSRAGRFSTGSTEPFQGFAARRNCLPERRRARAQRRGHRRFPGNYRGINLIGVAAKGFGAILLKRFLSERDQRTRRNQSDFSSGRGCTDEMHNLGRILEQRRSFQQATVMCFVDFASAFDSVNMDSLWRIMAVDGMPPKF